MASPSIVLDLPSQSMHSSTGWALSQVKIVKNENEIYYRYISGPFFKSEHSKCLFSRYDSGSPPVHGPHSKDFFQEPTIFSEDTLQSAKGGQRRKEKNVKETAKFYFLLINLVQNNLRATGY